MPKSFRRWACARPVEAVHLTQAHASGGDVSVLSNQPFFSISDMRREDTSRTYNEKFDGFVLSRFDGNRIRISDGAVHAL